MPFSPPRGKGARLVAAGALAVVAVGLAYALELRGAGGKACDYAQKIAAARLAADAFLAIREAKVKLGIPFPAEDVNRTGLIGPEATPLVSSVGHLGAKRTAANPNFAAVLVDMFHETGLRSGDVIALGFSGSFPSLNVATLAAAHVLGLRPLIISSVGASNFGASDPEMTWLDMEAALRENRIWHYRSFRAGLGGIGTLPRIFEVDPVALAMMAIRRNGIPFIEEEDLQAAVARRLAAYEEAAGGRRIRAFVNIGGTAVNLGESPRAQKIPVGLQLLPMMDAHRARGVIFKMAERGIPIIHLLNIRRLARWYGIPFDPSPLPPLGEGPVFLRCGRHF